MSIQIDPDADLRSSIVLSNGKAVAFMSYDEMVAFADAQRKMARVLGRTPHYKRKNREAIAKCEDDLWKIDREHERRNRLKTLSLCGIVFHYDGRHFRDLEHPDTGKKIAVFRFVRLHDPSRPWRSSHATQELFLTQEDINLAKLNGAIGNELDDPSCPWSIAKDQEDK